MDFSKFDNLWTRTWYAWALLKAKSRTGIPTTALLFQVHGLTIGNRNLGECVRLF